MKKLYVAWQTPQSRKWTVVGVLEYKEGLYKFSYTKGTRNIPGFQRFGSMTHDSYEAKELFPFFSNRLLSESRPEYASLLEWMNIKRKEYDPLDALALTEGKRGTDTIELFACPEPADAKFIVTFFTHGVRHTHVANQEALSLIKQHDILYLMQDFQNPHDPHAFAIRTGDPVCLLGYLPRYLASDIQELVKKTSPASIHTTIVKINNDAPLSYRFLCQIEAPWPEGFTPCAGEDYLPL